MTRLWGTFDFSTEKAAELESDLRFTSQRQHISKAQLLTDRGKVAKNPLSKPPNIFEKNFFSNSNENEGLKRFLRNKKSESLKTHTNNK